MPRLLLLTYHFPPSAAVAIHRLLGFARHLAPLGWDLAVLAPPHLPWEPRDPSLVERIPTETVVRRVPYPSASWTYPVRRLAPWLCWLPPARIAAERLIREIRPDVILTSGPPHCIHVLGMALKRRHRIPLVADFRDPWVSCPWAPPDRPARGPNLRQRWEARQERRLMREANAIIANTPNTAQALAGVYPLARKRITSIPNGFDPEAFEQPLPLAPTPPDAPITILHPGQLYAGRDPRPLLRAIASLHRDERCEVRFHLRFVGHLERDARDYDLAAEARALDLDSAVTVEPQMPYGRVLEAMRRSDVLLLLDTPSRRLGVPAKLYEFLGAGRPILALTERGSDSDAILASSRATHFQAAPSDTAGIVRALRDLAPVVLRQRVASDSQPPRPADSPYTRENATRRLATLLESVRRAPGRTYLPDPRATPRRDIPSTPRVTLPDVAQPPDPGHSIEPA